ncbi:MAG: ParB N-terminal domain-containing protein [Clostridia bacterium]|nr:ParB N-terminal domain-containing protein [Clostridia bacterium]
MENNKKINMGFFDDEETTKENEPVKQEEKEEKKEIRQPVENGANTNNINEKEKKYIVELVDVNLLNENDNQPFKIIENTDDFKTLEKSVSILGIKTPLQIIVENGKYRIIEGHRRVRVAKKLGIQKVPCIIVENDKDKNAIQMVDGNITQRQKLLTSELVRAYALKYEALKNMGLYTEETKEAMSKEYEKSVRTIERFLKLSSLTEDFLCFIDEYEMSKERGIPKNIGLIIADMKPENQEVLYIYLVEKNIKLTENQAKELRNIQELTPEKIDEVINKKKKVDKRKNISIPYKKVESFFTDKESPEEQIEIILKALEKYFENTQ